MSGIEAQNDREVMIQLDSKVDKIDAKLDMWSKTLVEALGRFEVTLVNIKKEEINEINKRVLVLERCQTEREGSDKTFRRIASFIIFLAALTAVISGFIGWSGIKQRNEIATDIEFLKKKL